MRYITVLGTLVVLTLTGPSCTSVDQSDIEDSVRSADHTTDSWTSSEYAKLVHSSPSVADGARFDPVALIRAVNELLPLGKEEALDVLTSYMAICEQQEQHDSGFDKNRVIPICRLLFVGAGGEQRMPRLVFGQPLVSDINIKQPLWPKYPILTEQGFPVVCEAGYVLAGVTTAAEDHVVFCRLYCELRREPLLPQSAPTECIDALELRLGTTPNDKKVLSLLRWQAKNALSTMPEVSQIADPSSDQGWNRLKMIEKRYSPMWSSSKQRYVYNN